MAGRRADGPWGFSILELLLVVSVSVILLGISIPAVNGARQRLELRATLQEVAQNIRAARLRSVTTGRTLRIRFNCPGAGQYRVVEWTGSAAIDDAATRCTALAFPYPDTTPGTLPDLDGPVVDLTPGVTLVASAALIVTPNGRITPTGGVSPASITASYGRNSRSLTVSLQGRITLQ